MLRILHGAAHAQRVHSRTLIAMCVAGLLAATLVAVVHRSQAVAAPPTPIRGAVFDRPDRPEQPNRDPGGAEVELTERRTAKSRTYRTAQGSLVTKIFAEPVNFRAGTSFKAIDNTLQASDGVIRNGSNRYALELPARLGTPVRATEGTHSVSYELLDAAPRTAVVRDNEARYENALPGVDVLYAAESDGVKESLVLDGPDATSSFRFRLEVTGGLTPRAAAAGAIDFVTATGSVAFSFAPPFLQDASATERGFSRAVKTTLERSGEDYVLTLSADRAWLNEPARRFPVVLDPTLEFGGADKDCYIVDGTRANTNYCGYQTLNAGFDGTNRNRSLLQFDIAAYIPAQVEVLDAELGLYLGSKSTANATTLSAHRLTRPWTYSFTGVTWNRHDGTNAWTAPGGDFEAATAATTTAGGALGWVRLHPTDLVQSWTDGSMPNHGFLLKTTENVNNRLVFNSTVIRSKTPPYLAVTYEPRVGQLDRYEFDGEEPPDTVTDVDVEEPAADPFRFDVNVANGNLLVRERDVLLASARGLPLEIERFYNNLDPNATQLGGGWTSDTGIDIELVAFADGSVAFYGASGAAKRFARRADGSFTPAPGLDAELSRSADGTYRLLDHDSDLVLNFNATGRLASRSDEDGASHTYAYNSLGDVTRITDADGKATTFTYDGFGFLTRITEPDGSAHTYTHASNTKASLTSYTDPSGARTTMSYDGLDNLVRIVDRRGRDFRFTYDADFRVTSITQVTSPATGTGTKTTYDYGTRSTTVTTPDGRRTIYSYDASSVVRQVRSATSPPSLTLSGTLLAQDGRTLNATGSYDLRVDGQDADGVREIKIDTDGDAEEDSAATPCSGTTCTLTWTLAAEEFVPGEVLVRATVTDALGNASSQIIVVVIPPWSADIGDAPPPPATKEQRIEQARAFRTDFGLPSDDGTLEERDSDALAQAGAEQWGVPVIPAESDQLETRLDIQVATKSINDYIKNTPGASQDYAGGFIDQASGGLVRIGFVRNAEQHLAAIRQRFARPVTAFAATRTEGALDDLVKRISDDIPALRAEGTMVNAVSKIINGNLVEVGVPSPDDATRQKLEQRYGPGIRLVMDEGMEEEQQLIRFQRYRRMAAGLQIVPFDGTTMQSTGCTIAYSAYGRTGGRTVYRHLTAGHCGDTNTDYWKQGGRRIGSPRVNADRRSRTFADAQSLTARRARTSVRVFGPAFRRVVTQVETKANEFDDQIVCKSGRVTGVTCGKLTSTNHTVVGGGNNVRVRQRLATYNSTKGDSGAPVYQRVPRSRDAIAVGVHSGNRGTGLFGIQRRRVYSHIQWVQNELGVRVCVRGAARCGR